MNRLKRKIVVAACALTIGAAGAGAIMHTGLRADAAVATPTDVSDKDQSNTPAEKKNGWVTENGRKRYYINDVMQKNKLLKLTETEKGRKITRVYYLKSDGAVYGGLKRVNGKLYYFDTSNTSHKGSAVTGWITFSGRRYYFGSDYKAVSGLKKISGYRFYFDSKNIMVKNLWKGVNGRLYYFSGNGKAYTGLRKIGKYYYYFDKYGVTVRNRFATISGRRYYFGDRGRAYTGVKKVKGYKYYLNFSGKGYLVGGAKRVNGTHYRFKSNGKPYTGWYTSKNGLKYYYKANGTFSTGPVTVGKKTYLFNERGMLISSEGWRTINNKTFYVTSEGVVLKGYKRMGEDYYYFNKNGVMYKNKWAYAQGYKFYFGRDGKRLVDVSGILGKQDSYEIVVDKTGNVITVYAKDGDKGYIIPVKAMICSTGETTPLGTYYTPNKWRWLTLEGPCYGQWDTQIVGDFLFHSVFYGEVDPNTLSVSAYNNLGTMCSHGCIRLTARDAKWMYDNCDLGTKVTICESGAGGPFPKPTSVQLESWHTWDPTDPTMAYKCKENGCHKGLAW